MGEAATIPTPSSIQVDRGSASMASSATFRDNAGLGKSSAKATIPNPKSTSFDRGDTVTKEKVSPSSSPDLTLRTSMERPFSNHPRSRSHTPQPQIEPSNITQVISALTEQSHAIKALQIAVADLDTARRSRSPSPSSKWTEMKRYLDSKSSCAEVDELRHIVKSLETKLSEVQSENRHLREVVDRMENSSGEADKLGSSPTSPFRHSPRQGHHQRHASFDPAAEGYRSSTPNFENPRAGRPKAGTDASSVSITQSVEMMMQDFRSSMRDEINTVLDKLKETYPPTEGMKISQLGTAEREVITGIIQELIKEAHKGYSADALKHLQQRVDILEMKISLSHNPDILDSTVDKAELGLAKETSATSKTNTIKITENHKLINQLSNSVKDLQSKIEIQEKFLNIPSKKARDIADVDALMQTLSNKLHGEIQADKQSIQVRLDKFEAFLADFDMDFGRLKKQATSQEQTTTAKLTALEKEFQNLAEVEKAIQGRLDFHIISLETLRSQMKTREVVKQIDQHQTDSNAGKPEIPEGHVFTDSQLKKIKEIARQLDRLQSESIKEKIAKKVDTAVLEALMAHLCTKEDLSFHTQQVKSLAEFKDLAADLNGLRNHLVENSASCRTLYDKLRSEFDLKMRQFERGLHDFRERVSVDVDRKLTDSRESSAPQRVPNRDGAAVRDKEEDAQIEPKPSQHQVDLTDENMAIIEQRVHNALSRKVVKEFDDKLFLLCSDLSACKSAFQIASKQPFYRCAQWLWKSERLKFSSAVPWNYESCNTDPDNFRWEQDQPFIRIVEGGLYEISFAFFTKCKPSIQLVVNGESVLSAINAPTYVVHHSSGLILSGDGRLESGCVTGLSLLP
ncbi:hypothetical protein HDU76_007076 [Blyttiomyces sp. JEL0837]|nr:hypothetical protein HDU76_007076 [Blyttiomyces sp. JEL0837]